MAKFLVKVVGYTDESSSKDFWSGVLFCGLVLKLFCVLQFSLNFLCNIYQTNTISEEILFETRHSSSIVGSHDLLSDFLSFELDKSVAFVELGFERL